jgi:hypothetical protein
MKIIVISVKLKGRRENNITHVTTHVQSKIQDRSRRAKTDSTNVKMFNKPRIYSYSLEDIKKFRLKIVKGFQVKKKYLLVMNTAVAALQLRCPSV